MAREYKDSGIEWIGQIPKEWKLPRLKNVAELHGRIGWNGLRSDEFEENSYAYLVTGQDFKTSEIVWNNCYQIRKERYEEDPFIQLHNGEILVTKDGTIGKIAIVSKMDKPGCLNSGIFVLRQKKNSFVPKYLYWQLYSSLLKTYNDYMNLGGTTIIHLYQNVFERMPLISPSLPLQQKIADYLDKVCGEVDEIVSLQETMIEELKAYKQSVITEAVTRGLNPNVPMRDSGIDWIGEIPEHWDVRKIGRLFRLRDEKNYKPMEEVQLLSLYTGIGVFPHGEQEERGNKAVTVEGYKVVHKDDIVVNIILAWMGAIGVSDYDGVTSPAYDVYIPDIPKVIPHFFHYVFRTKGIAAECYKYGRGIMMMRWRTYSSEFKQISVPYPSIEEQQHIASYLDTKCSEIDSLIALKQAKIEELKEYKKSVIYEYVTGKKEVC